MIVAVMGSSIDTPKRSRSTDLVPVIDEGSRKRRHLENEVAGEGNEDGDSSNLLCMLPVEIVVLIVAHLDDRTRGALRLTCTEAALTVGLRRINLPLSVPTSVAQFWRSAFSESVEEVGICCINSVSCYQLSRFTNLQKVFTRKARAGDRPDHTQHMVDMSCWRHKQLDRKHDMEASTLIASLPRQWECLVPAYVAGFCARHGSLTPLRAMSVITKVPGAVPTPITDKNLLVDTSWLVGSGQSVAGFVDWVSRSSAIETVVFGRQGMRPAAVSPLQEPEMLFDVVTRVLSALGPRVNKVIFHGRLLQLLVPAIARPRAGTLTRPVLGGVSSVVISVGTTLHRVDETVDNYGIGGQLAEWFPAARKLTTMINDTDESPYGHSLTSCVLDGMVSVSELQIALGSIGPKGEEVLMTFLNNMGHGVASRIRRLAVGCKTVPHYGPLGPVRRPMAVDRLPALEEFYTNIPTLVQPQSTRLTDVRIQRVSGLDMSLMVYLDRLSMTASPDLTVRFENCTMTRRLLEELSGAYSRYQKVPSGGGGKESSTGYVFQLREIPMRARSKSIDS
jgi:hypothetical protein